MKIPLQKLIVQLHVGSLAMLFVKIYHRIRKGPKSSELSLTRQDKKRHDKTRQDKTSPVRTDYPSSSYQYRYYNKLMSKVNSGQRRTFVAMHQFINLFSHCKSLDGQEEILAVILKSKHVVIRLQQW